MEDDVIKKFMRETRSSGLFRELKMRQCFVSKPERRKLKDRRAAVLRRKAEARRIRVMTKPRKFYDETRHEERLQNPSV